MYVWCVRIQAHTLPWYMYEVGRTTFSSQFFLPWVPGFEFSSLGLLSKHSLTVFMNFCLESPVLWCVASLPMEVFPSRPSWEMWGQEQRGILLLGSQPGARHAAGHSSAWMYQIRNLFSDQCPETDFFCFWGNNLGDVEWAVPASQASGYCLSFHPLQPKFSLESFLPFQGSFPAWRLCLSPTYPGLCALLSPGWVWSW